MLCYNATRLPNTIDIGQNLATLSQKQQVSVFIWKHCCHCMYYALSPYCNEAEIQVR